MQPHVGAQSCCWPATARGWLWAWRGPPWWPSPAPGQARGQGPPAGNLLSTDVLFVLRGANRLIPLAQCSLPVWITNPPPPERPLPSWGPPLAMGLGVVARPSGGVGGDCPWSQGGLGCLELAVTSVAAF